MVLFSDTFTVRPIISGSRPDVIAGDNEFHASVEPK
jgi:hypothetical protein